MKKSNSVHPRPVTPAKGLIENWEEYGKYLSGVIALGAFLFSSLGLLLNPIKEDRDRIELNHKIFAQQEEQLVKLKIRLDSLKRLNYEIKTPDTKPSEIDHKINELYIDFDSLEKRFSKIEAIIIKSPEEALEIPLIKREIEDFKILNESKFETLNKDIERAYTIILASLAALGVSIFAPALSSLIQRLRFSNTENTKSENKADSREDQYNNN